MHSSSLVPGDHGGSVRSKAFEASSAVPPGEVNAEPPLGTEGSAQSRRDTAVSLGIIRLRALSRRDEAGLSEAPRSAGWRRLRTEGQVLLLVTRLLWS